MQEEGEAEGGTVIKKRERTAEGKVRTRGGTAGGRREKKVTGKGIGSLLTDQSPPGHGRARLANQNPRAICRGRANQEVVRGER